MSSINRRASVLDTPLLTQQLSNLQNRFATCSTVCNSYECIGSELIQRGQPDTALKLHRKAIDTLKSLLQYAEPILKKANCEFLIYSQQKNLDSVAANQQSSYTLLALHCLKASSCLKLLNRYEEALETLQTGLSNLPTIPDTQIIAAQLHYKLGSVFVKLNQLQKASENFEKALEKYENNRSISEPSLIPTYTILSEILEKLQKPEKSLIYRNKILDISLKTKSKNDPQLTKYYSNKIECLMQIANQFYVSKKYQKSEKFVRQALEIASEVSSEEERVPCHVRLGQILKYLERYPEALLHLEKAVEIIEQKNLEKHIHFVRLHRLIGDIFEALNNDQKALIYREKTVKIAEEYLPQDFYSLYEAHNYLSIILKKLGNLDEASAQAYIAKKYLEMDRKNTSASMSSASSTPSIGDRKGDELSELPVFVSDRPSPELTRATTPLLKPQPRPPFPK